MMTLTGPDNGLKFRTQALREALNVLGWTIHCAPPRGANAATWTAQARRGAEILVSEGPDRDTAAGRVLRDAAAAVGHGWHVVPMRGGVPLDLGAPLPDEDTARVVAAIALGRGTADEVRIVHVGPQPAKPAALRRGPRWVQPT